MSLHVSDVTWVKWLRMLGHRLFAILDMLEVTRLNPGPGKINLIKKLKKTPKGFLTLKKSTSLRGIKGRLS